MKTFNKDYLLVSILSAVLFASVDYSRSALANFSPCPPTNQTDPSCVCYQLSHRLICPDISKPFDLDTEYTLKTLVIKNSPKLLSEHFHSLPNKTSPYLYVDKLIIELDEYSAVQIPANLEDILSLSTRSVEIDGDGTFNKTLHVLGLSPNLNSLSIRNVESVEYFDFEKFTVLENLVLENIGFKNPINDVELIETSLKLVQIINTTLLAGAFIFKPFHCNAGEQIEIDLRSNFNLTSFDFSHLFLNKNCSYHIDLTGNENLDSNLLKSQAKVLADHPGQFYLILRDVPAQECDCAVVNMYKDNADYIHGAQCKLGNESPFLDQILEKLAKVCQLKPENPVPESPKDGKNSK